MELLEEKVERSLAAQQLQVQLLRDILEAGPLAPPPAAALPPPLSPLPKVERLLASPTQPAGAADDDDAPAPAASTPQSQSARPTRRRNGSGSAGGGGGRGSRRASPAAGRPLRGERCAADAIVSEGWSISC